MMQQKDKMPKTDDDTEIPIITDCVVVQDVHPANPPASNPDHVPTASVQAAGMMPVANVTTYQPPIASSTSLYYNMGRNPTGLKCPHCHRQTITTTRDLIGVGTIIAILVLAFLFVPICWLPLCIPSCRRTHHYCCHDACRKKVGETSVCA